MPFQIVNIGTSANDGTGDPLRTAFNKVNQNFAAIPSGLSFLGVWNASTNTPSLASGVGTNGTYYIVGVAGSTTLDGLSTWMVGDYAIFIGGVWTRVPISETALDGYVARFTWDSATVSPAASVPRTFPNPVRDNLHNQMRGCVLNANGTINYYLNPTDWALKADGTASTLTGADGNVMVEIPRFYYRISRAGTETTWEVSPIELSGFTVHPAFIKDGVEVPFRYYGAYDASVFDVSASVYLSGLNWDNNSGAGNGVEVDVTATTGDKLASVSGVYPMVGLTRGEFRTIAANVGSGWRQLDFHLWQAVGLLYLVEYQTFFNQNVLGAGNTNGSYFAASGDQNDSPHTIAGAGNALANTSTNVTSGAGVSAKPGTSFMRYRGIENYFGNCWNWADGINLNAGASVSAGQGTVHVTNNATDWADPPTVTNYTLISSSLATSADNIQTLLAVDPWFLAATTGGTSAQYVTDRHFGSTEGNHVAHVGGRADSGAAAGVFAMDADISSSLRNRNRGGRLSR